VQRKLHLRELVFHQAEGTASFDDLRDQLRVNLPPLFDPTTHGDREPIPASEHGPSVRGPIDLSPIGGGR
jgi:hypothetical protein